MGKIATEDTGDKDKYYDVYADRITNTTPNNRF